MKSPAYSGLTWICLGLTVATWAGLAAASALPATAPTATSPAATPSAAPAVTATAAAAATAVPKPTPTAPAAPVLPPTATDAQHFAIGEIKFGDGWVSIESLFKDYQQAGADQKALAAKSDTAQGTVIDLTRQLNEAKNATAKQEQPLKADLVKQKAKQRDLQKALDAPAPKLTLQPVPPMPTPPTGGGGGYGGGTNPQYTKAMQDRQKIIDANTQAQAKYKQDMTTYTDAVTQAKKDLPTVLTALKQDEDQIQKLEADLQTQTAPIIEKQQPANQDLAGLTQQKDVLDSRIKALAAAMHDAPENVRFHYGIIEWNGTFGLMADLEKTLADNLAEIDRLREQMKAEAKAAGRSFPADWRHPEQDNLDALKVLLARAKTAQGTK